MAKRIISVVKIAKKSKISSAINTKGSNKYNKSIRSTIEEGKAYLERLK